MIAANSIFIKKHRAVILLVLALILFACHGLFEESTAHSSWIDCISTFFVLMLFLSISYDGITFSIWGSIVAGTAFCMIWLDNIFPAEASLFRQFEDISLLLLIGTFIFKNVYTLIAKNLIGSEHLCASFALYLLLGIWWGFLYNFIWIIDPSSFSGDSTIPFTLGDFFQFSLSTITTVSMSAISAHTSLIRCLGTIEAVCGQFYFAMLIGGLVGAHFAYRSKLRNEVEDSTELRK